PRHTHRRHQPQQVYSRTTLAAQPDPTFVEAVKLHQSGQFAAAVEKYRAVLKTSPNSLEARSNLGVALAALGRYDEAIIEYRQALRGTPGHRALRLNLGLAYFKAERVKEAIAEFSALHKTKPRHLQPALLLANCHTMLGDYKAV